MLRCECAHVYLCMHLYMCACINGYVLACVCVHVCMCVSGCAELDFCQLDINISGRRDLQLRNCSFEPDSWTEAVSAEND